MKKLFYLAVVLLLAAPQTSQAVGSFSLTTSDLLSTTSLTSASSVAKLSGLTFNTVTVGTVSLALELEELGTSMQSPHHNVTVITSGTENSASVVANHALVTVQQTAGGSNVTLSLNSIVTGGAGASGSTAPSIAPTSDPTMLVVLAGNPAFAVMNSFVVAEKLLLREAFNAFTSGTASVTNAIALDVLHVGVNEFSPHHNVGSGNTAVNSAGVSSNTGLVTVQQQAGFSNIQVGINQLVVTSGAITTSGLSF
jgi:hypothetical protein